MRLAFSPARSKVRVIAYAPGHRFVAEGSGIEGSVEIDEDRVLELRARFPLFELDAGDRLKNHELGRFLELDRRPFGEAELLGPLPLSRSQGGELRLRGPIQVGLPGRRMSTVVEAWGKLPKARARFDLTFTGLGYKPPKLLLLKVKDRIEVEVEIEIED